MTYPHPPKHAHIHPPEKLRPPSPPAAAAEPGSRGTSHLCTEEAGVEVHTATLGTPPGPGGRRAGCTGQCQEENTHISDNNTLSAPPPPPQDLSPISQTRPTPPAPPHGPSQAPPPPPPWSTLSKTRRSHPPLPTFPATPPPHITPHIPPHTHTPSPSSCAYPAAPPPGPAPGR